MVEQTETQSEIIQTELTTVDYSQESTLQYNYKEKLV